MTAQFFRSTVGRRLRRADPERAINTVEDSGGPELLGRDGDIVLFRTRRDGVDGRADTIITALAESDHPMAQGVDRLTHEYDLKEHLDACWALRPLELVQERGRSVLVLEDTGGDLLSHHLSGPMAVERFLRLAIGITAAISKMHQQGLVHKDIKPANVLVNDSDGRIRLTGFGLASRLARERQTLDPPEFIAGTLAYMAPEQTGRTNRSIDSRSDLYALGVTFYQMLTGALPFSAVDPIEWIHCHIARQPPSPTDRVPSVPPEISAIVMKLLAKAAEDRYQTAAGLEHDLRRCLLDWESLNRINQFPLGKHDISGRLLIPEKLYGREGEIDTLVAAFDRVLSNGGPELVLVSGYSGIGKSAVVNELHKALLLPRGLFASGKFDQYKRDIPYATLAQAFQGLIRQLLGQSEAELAKWRDEIHEALGLNGALIVDLVPELKLIIGSQPIVPELPPQESNNRFQLILRRFIQVFARAEHPLALFLDDVQWLDAATLDLLESVMTQSDMRHLLLICAYRDNEVGPEHPLTRMLEAIRACGTKPRYIVLGPLAREDMTRLIVDSLHCDADQAWSLAQLTHEKTGGNPFFAIQFISALVDEELLSFDYASAQWRWDLSGIEAKGYTDNVVSLMADRLHRLPAATRESLQILACLGNRAEIAALSMLLGRSTEKVHADLWEARRAELIARSASSYKFVHDRVQEAAYSLIPEQQRANEHLRIGRFLATHVPPQERNAAIFEIVAQFDRGRGAELITGREEREQVAELYLAAGKRAKVAAAYASALKYLVSGAALLDAGSWEQRRDLIFEMELHRSGCEFLTGDLDNADARLMRLSSRAATLSEQSAVACLRVDLCMTLDQPDRAVSVCLDYLQMHGVEWSLHPTKEEAQREYDLVWSRLGTRPIEDLIELPLMTDPTALATLDVMTRALLPMVLTDGNLLCQTICRIANLSLQYGNSDGSCLAYVWFGMMARTRFGNHNDGLKFGRLGFELVEKRGLRRFQGRTYRAFAELAALWTMPIRACCSLHRLAFETSNRDGDLTYAAYNLVTLSRILLVAGQPLADVQREVETAFTFAQATHFGFMKDLISPRLGLIQTLRGLTSRFGSLQSEEFDEPEFEQHLAGNQRLAIPECWYWIGKLQARFHAGDCPAADHASQRAQRLLSMPITTTIPLASVEYRFYAALAHAACIEAEDGEERKRHFEALLEHHRQIEVWATQCPENFENRAALVGAEVARIEGREPEAQRLYERAIHSAHVNGFVNNEALANELAARFHAARGLETIAHAYLREARACYVRWGADGKVRQLDQLYPFLRNQNISLTGTMQASVEQVDLATVIKLSQVISGEIILERLIDTLMRTVIEHAGAERGLLILPRGDEYYIEAEASTLNQATTVDLRQAKVAATDMPISVLRYVLRTKEAVLLHDASCANTFSEDEYLRERHARSILCLPLMKQARVLGLLYLENNLVSDVFTSSRMTVLNLLASSSAISLENTRLYRDLQEREARVRRLVDSNIVGIFIFHVDGQIIDGNDAFLQMVGRDRDDLVSGSMLWTELTPPEWRSVTDQRRMDLKATGTIQPYEKAFFRKDGSRVPVLVGAAMFDASGDQGVAFVVNLTDRKRAEESARESQRRYHEVQNELTHANRVATMGQLAASIAHEVNQPIAASRTNAETALRWLERSPPDLERAKRAIERVVADGRRAADIVGGLRALVKRAPARNDSLEVNKLVLEVVALTHSEMLNHDIVLVTELAEGLPLVQGDRVQLEQVILNLVMNAIEAMSQMAGGRRELLVSAQLESGCVVVSVRDSGPGFPEGGLAKIFEAFYTTKESGLGMGLSICRSIIEAHEGTLWASQNDGPGATFQFTLPADGCSRPPA